MNIRKLIKQLARKHRYPDGKWLVQPMIPHLLKIIDYNIKDSQNVTLNAVTEKEVNVIAYGIVILNKLIIYKIEDL